MKLLSLANKSLNKYFHSRHLKRLYLNWMELNRHIHHLTHQNY